VVKFQAALDPNRAVKNKAINPINSLEIITPRIGETLGAVPTGADAAANDKANPPVPATARTLAIIGRIVSYAKGELTVSADGRVFKADLDPAPVVQQPLEIAEGELAGTEPEDLIAHDQASPTCLYNFGLIACHRFREKPGPRKAAQVPQGTSVSAHVA
jgi:hypothetical protein